MWTTCAKGPSACALRETVRPSCYGPLMPYRAFSYLLQPTVRQAAAFDRLLEAQRELYNAALDERRVAWR